MKPSPELIAYFNRVSGYGLLTAGIGGVICVFGYFNLHQQFLAAYQVAFLYWLGMSLGCLALAMIHGMTGGAWGRMVRRIVESGYETLPLMALLFLPIWLGAASIYEWADPEIVQQHEVLQRKAGYLNVAGLQWRSIVYFAIWIISGQALNRYSPNQEHEADSPRSRSLQKVSGLGFMLYGFTFSLAAVDWFMSLEPEWYSTMYALIHIAGQGALALSFALIAAVALRDFKPWSQIVTPVRLNDYGNLMLASVMFWAYCSFFQYLVIWSGNLPEENSWYVHRSQGGWQYLAISLMLLHFAVPFLLLLPRRVKRDAQYLCRIALLLLAMHYVDLYWIVAPGFQRTDDSYHGFTFHWIDPVALVTIGGLWLSVFVWRLSVRIRLPLFDPRFEEVK